MPGVSVIVPLYNKAKYVLRTLRSIARQSYSDFEVIIVDDGSTDGSAELAAGYPDGRFRLVRQPNGGPGAARNRGLREARGELAAFLDADDLWLPKYLESCVELLNLSGPDVASVTFGYLELPKGISRERMWRRRGLTEGVHRVRATTPPRLLVHMLAYMTPCSTVARTEVLRRWGGFYDRNGARYGEDALLWLKVLLNEPVCFAMRPLVVLDRAASALSSNLAAARPIEPFLLAPDLIRSSCPPDLLPVLERLYAIRACKTATVLGFSGEWQKARQLVAKYVSRQDWNVPYLWPALVGCTPAAALIRRIAAFARLRQGRFCTSRQNGATQEQIELARQWVDPDSAKPNVL